MKHPLMQAVTQKKEFCDVFGLKINVTVRRSGSPHALELFGGNAGISREQFEAMKRNINKLAGTQEKSPELDELVTYSLFTNTKYAAAFVAGWSGKFFASENLPVNGAFTIDDVINKFFGSLGGPDDEEEFVFAKFYDIETGEPIVGQHPKSAEVGKLYNEAIEIINRENAPPVTPSRESMQDEEYRIALTTYQEEISEWIKTRAGMIGLNNQVVKDHVAKCGVSMCDYAGKTLREAMHMFVCKCALELEKDYTERVGSFLSPYSPASKDSKGSAKKPTKKRKLRR